jgi:Na+-transporting NADH:ubiquinone oxidoreductase subunit NqrF
VDELSSVILVEGTLVVVVVERERLAVALGVAKSGAVLLVVDVALSSNNLASLNTTFNTAAVALRLGSELGVASASCCGGGGGRGRVSGRVGDALASRAHTSNLVLAIFPVAEGLDSRRNIALLIAAAREPVLAEVG